MKFFSSLAKTLESYKIRKDTQLTFSLHKDGRTKPLYKKNFGCDKKISLLNLISVFSYIFLTISLLSFIANKCREKKIIKKLEKKYLFVPIDKLEYENDIE